MPYTAETFANNVNTTVGGGSGGAGSALLSTDTSLLLPTGVGTTLPSAGPSRLVVGNLLTGYEVMTWATKSGDTLSGLVRGLEGTTALTWAFGTAVAASTATAGSFATLYAALNQGRAFYVQDYGAKVDGSTDDTVAIQAALTAAGAAGGGEVVLGRGRSVLSVQGTVTPTNHSGAVSYCLQQPSNVVLRGVGPASELFLAASQSGEVVGIINTDPTTGDTNHNLTCRDFTLNGNANNQGTPTHPHHGLSLYYVAGLTVERVISKNWFGDGTHEGHQFLTNSCTNVTYLRCVATTDDGGGVASMYGAAYLTNGRFDGCVASGVAANNGQGFTDYYCTDLLYVGCQALNLGFTNVTNGFFTEQSNNISYVGCVSGGEAQWKTGFAQNPYTVGQTLPNKYGFTVVGGLNIRYDGCHAVANNQSGYWVEDETNEGANNRSSSNIGYTNCSARKNGQHGFVLINTSQDVTYVNCLAQSNTSVGFFNDSTATAGVVKYVACRTVSNATGYEVITGAEPYSALIQCQSESDTNAANLKGTNYASIAGAMTAPGVPASGTALTNPFSLPMTIYIQNGTLTTPFIQVGGTATGQTATPAVVHLSPRQTITLTYSSAPTWTWFAE